MSKNIRNFLCNDYNSELDIINCCPSILLYLTDIYNIDNQYLKQYVNNRNEILEKNKLTKLDIIIAINTDENSTKRNKRLYN